MKTKSPRRSIVQPSSPDPADDPNVLPPLFGDPRHLKFAAGAFALATLLVFGLLLFNGGDQILSLSGADLSTVFVGWSDFTFGEMAKGNLPLWNPHLFGGAPCLGGFQEALLYPPSWLHLIMPMPQAFNWGIALHVFLAGFFTYLWMARRGLHPLASFLAGLIFMFGGGYFMHISAGHLPNLRTMVWVPLIFLAIDDLTTTKSLRGAWLGAGAVAMAIYAGHVQYVYFTAVIAIPYALLGLWSIPSRQRFQYPDAGSEVLRRAGSDAKESGSSEYLRTGVIGEQTDHKATSKIRALTGLALLGIGGAALSAVQLFTGLGAAAESARTQLPIEVARTFAFPPENLLTLAMPSLFGQLSGDLAYWGRWFLWEDSLFIGMTATILAVYGAVRGEPKRRRFAVTFLIVSLLLAFGYYTPLYGFLFRYFPGFASFRGVSKFAFMAALFLANLAAVGFDRLLQTCGSKTELSLHHLYFQSMRTDPRTPAIFVALCGAILTVFGVGLWISAASGSKGLWGTMLSHIPWSSEAYQYGAFGRNPLTPSFIRDSAHGAALNLCVAAAVCMIVAAMWLGAQKQRRWVYGIAAVATLELLGFAWQNIPTFDLKQITDAAKQLSHFASNVGPDGRAITGMPTLYMMGGGNDAWGNDPMVLRRYADLIAYDQGASADELLRRNYPFFSKLGPMWGLVRIKAAFVPASNGPGMMPAPCKGPTLARSQLIDTVEVVADPSKLLDTLADPKFVPSAKVLLEKPVSPMPSGDGGDKLGPGSVEIKDRTTDAIDIIADVRRTSILLVSDNYSSGWRVRSTDETPLQNDYTVVRADYTLRGIPLVAGKHHLLMEYKPSGYVVGKYVTLVSLMAYAIFGLLLWKPGILRARSSAAHRRA